MAIRMAIVGAVVLVAGIILTLYYNDLQFLFDGIVGASGAAISTAVAIAGQSIPPAGANDERGHGPAGPEA